METRTQSPPSSPGVLRPNGAGDTAAPTPAADKPASGNRRGLLLIGGGIVALIALIFGGRYFVYSLSHQGTDDAKIDADVVTVTSKISERVAQILVDTNQPVHKGQLLLVLDDRDEHTRYDQARAAYLAQKAQADAAQATVAFTRDQQNAQNQQNLGTIVQARSNISSATAQEVSQQDQVAAAAAALDAARAQLRAASEGVPSARAALDKARADLGRDTALVASGDVSRSHLDASRALYEAARSNYEQALSNVNAAQAQVTQSGQKLGSQRAQQLSSGAQVGVQQGLLQNAQGHLAESNAPSRLGAQEAQFVAAKAQANSAAALLRTASDQLSYTKIYSSIDGYVGEKNVEVGQTVSPGLSLFTLVPAQHIFVTANYKETQIGKMHPGQTVDIHVDACSGATLAGHIENIAPASENTFSLVPAQNATANFVKVTQRVPVRIVFDRPDPSCPLRPGMSVETYVNVKS